MYDIIPVECYPWIIVAFFVGYTGKNGVEYLLSILNTIEDDRGINDSEDDSEDSEDTDGSVGSYEQRRE